MALTAVIVTHAIWNQFRLQNCLLCPYVWIHTIVGIHINVYLTEFIFGVRVHPTEFPFKSSRVSDNKRFVSCEPSVMK